MYETGRGISSRTPTISCSQKVRCACELTFSVRELRRCQAATTGIIMPGATGHLDAGSSGYDAFYAMNLLPATHHTSPAMARSRQQVRQNKEWYGKSDSARLSDRDHRRHRSKRTRRHSSRAVRRSSPSNEELETEVATLKAELARRRAALASASTTARSASTSAASSSPAMGPTITDIQASNHRRAGSTTCSRVSKDDEQQLTSRTSISHYLQSTSGKTYAELYETRGPLHHMQVKLPASARSEIRDPCASARSAVSLASFRGHGKGSEASGTGGTLQRHHNSSLLPRRVETVQQDGYRGEYKKWNAAVVTREWELRNARNSTPITLYAEAVIRQGLEPFALKCG